MNPNQTKKINKTTNNFIDLICKSIKDELVV